MATRVQNVQNGPKNDYFWLSPLCSQSSILFRQMRGMISNCASSTMINQFEMRKVTHVSDQVLKLPCMFFGRALNGIPARRI